MQNGEAGRRQLCGLRGREAAKATARKHDWPEKARAEGEAPGCLQCEASTRHTQGLPRHLTYPQLLPSECGPPTVCPGPRRTSSPGDMGTVCI